VAGHLLNRQAGHLPGFRPGDASIEEDLTLQMGTADSGPDSVVRKYTTRAAQGDTPQQATPGGQTRASTRAGVPAGSCGGWGRCCGQMSQTAGCRTRRCS
jgi:hypothetical protein